MIDALVDVLAGALVLAGGGLVFRWYDRARPPAIIQRGSPVWTDADASRVVLDAGLVARSHRASQNLPIKHPTPRYCPTCGRAWYLP